MKLYQWSMRLGTLVRAVANAVALIDEDGLRRAIEQLNELIADDLSECNRHIAAIHRRPPTSPEAYRDINRILREHIKPLLDRWDTNGAVHAHTEALSSLLHAAEESDHFPTELCASAADEVRRYQRSTGIALNEARKLLTHATNGNTAAGNSVPAA